MGSKMSPVWATLLYPMVPALKGNPLLSRDTEGHIKERSTAWLGAESRGVPVLSIHFGQIGPQFWRDGLSYYIQLAY